jgi:hypothetical protein
LLHARYRITRSVELTLIRTGYLPGVSAKHVAGDTNLAMIPLWTGARYFPMEPRTGLYLAGELGFNVLLPTAQPTRGVVLFDDATERVALRFAANAGVGCILSEDLPFDIRAQGSVLNLGESSPLGSSLRTTYFALGLSAGFSFRL